MRVNGVLVVVVVCLEGGVMGFETEDTVGNEVDRIDDDAVDKAYRGNDFMG